MFKKKIFFSLKTFLTLGNKFYLDKEDGRSEEDLFMN